MTQIESAPVELTRPERAPDAGPLDDRFYDLVEARFRRIVRDNPGVATFLGIHTEDHRLGDGSRDAVQQELADERAHLAAIEALDPAGLSPSALLERELELHNVRRAIFDLDRHRVWERRSTAIDAVGDRAAEDEAARLDAHDRLHPAIEEGLHHLLDAGAEAVGVAEQRRDIAEHDARLRVVGYGAHEVLEVDFGS